MLSRNFWQKGVRVSFCNFHTVTLLSKEHIERYLTDRFYLVWKKKRNLLTIFGSKKWCILLFSLKVSPYFMLLVWQVVFDRNNFRIWCWWKVNIFFSSYTKLISCIKHTTYFVKEICFQKHKDFNFKLEVWRKGNWHCLWRTKAKKVEWAIWNTAQKNWMKCIFCNVFNKN